MANTTFNGPVRSENGFKVVIYANHLLRAAYPAMENAALKILKNSRSLEIEKKIIPIKKILNIIPAVE